MGRAMPLSHYRLIHVCLACKRERVIGHSSSDEDQYSHGYCSAEQWGDKPEQARECQAVARAQWGVS